MSFTRCSCSGRFSSSDGHQTSLAPGGGCVPLSLPSLVYAGKFSSESELPSQPRLGWTFVADGPVSCFGYLLQAGDMLVCTGMSPAEWIALAGPVDGSGYVTFNDVATPATPGVMSPADKAKLDGIEPGANRYVLPKATAVLLGGVYVDPALDSSSDNPVENRAVKAALDRKADRAATLAGYGIADAKIENGTVVLGGSSVTPLTASSPLDASKLSGTASVDTTGNAASASRVGHSFVVKVDGGSVEGVSLYTFDGSSRKSLDVRAGENVSLSAASGALTISASDTTYEASSDLPLMDGEASAGSSVKYARGDHVHPSDASKADKAATLAGYGIADAKIENGIITLGPDTITPLTSIPASGVTAGTYTSVTVGTDGRVTAGTNPSTIAGYGITDAYTKTEIDQKLTSGMHYKGSVATVSQLPASGNEVGDFYNVVATGENYAWDGSAWDLTGSIVDLVAITNAEIDDIVAS